MMLGGGLMMVVGLLFLILIIGIPIFLGIAMLGGGLSYFQKQNQPISMAPNPVYATSNQAIQTNQPSVALSRYCSHCGAGLQVDWTHCPQCGAPVS